MHALIAYPLLGILSYIGLTVLLYALSLLAPSSLSTSMTFYARLLASWFCLLLCATYGVIASLFLRLVGRGGLSQWTVARAFKWSMYATTGVWFTIEGEEHLQTRPAVFVGNHQTELDVAALGHIFAPYTSVTAKSSLKYIPFLGWFMVLSKSVFIDRANRATARNAFDGAAEVMRKERQSVFIFPEGTRSYADSPMLLPFKKGAFHLAVKAQVPVVPVVVENYAHILNVKRRTFKAGTIRISVLPPIETTGLTPADVDDLTQRTRDAMLKEHMRMAQRHSDGSTLPTDTAISSGVDSGKKVAAEL
ncbi:1-acylglycerol-3-phosphate O-acyltransferase [Coniosporium apollinis]|uniref:1-acyl-sn-glycerol-3-phosphate acyltransferase n=2 Tax=Coniosporium TaxID=2810619 RepID=A0ABQ9NUW5_9PEZI|nr:1-acylglycerol-3-phosphate O-acyltransferase [Cladosporium sp. JES 115]KAJ9666181.1 1-acylglycerol-3-phosphate O-acyltransferase [Coniosporium apollinis]